MSNSKISALTAATTPLAGTEVLPIVQSSATTKVAISDVTAGRSVSGANFVVTSSTIPANGIYLPATNSVGIATNSGLKATIDASGYLGINNTAPATYLDIVGAVGTVTSPTFLNQTVAVLRNNFHTRMAFVNPSNTYSGDISRYNSSAAFPTNTLSLNGASGFIFTSGDGTVATTEKLRIDQSGNVGIGTSSATVKLQVNGGVAIQGAGFPTAGAGIELSYNSGTSLASLQSYDRTGSAWKDLEINTLTSRFGTGGTERMRIDAVGNMQIQSGAVMPYAPAPTGISAATTLTNAQIQGQIISATGTTYTITMPLGSTLETLATWATTNIGYDFFVINTATGIITMAVNTGVTSLGLLTIAAATSAHFRIRRTAANTFVLYRLV